MPSIPISKSGQQELQSSMVHYGQGLHNVSCIFHMISKFWKYEKRFDARTGNAIIMLCPALPLCRPGQNLQPFPWIANSVLALELLIVLIQGIDGNNMDEETLALPLGHVQLMEVVDMLQDINAVYERCTPEQGCWEPNLAAGLALIHLGDITNASKHIQDAQNICPLEENEGVMVINASLQRLEREHLDFA